MMAVRRGNLDTVNVLLGHNADVTVTDTKDKTCLHVAAEEDCINVFKVSIPIFKMYRDTNVYHKVIICSNSNLNAELKGIII